MKLFCLGLSSIIQQSIGTMGKTRMALLDLQVQVRELQSRLVGSRVANIYDVNSRTFIFKLSVPPYLQALHDSKTTDEKQTKETSWKKVLLLVESGARIHLTQFDRGKGSIPSGLCLKLRKHIRTKRLDRLEQLGGDRIIDLTFTGGGQPAFHVIAEFYAGGNIILTDHDYRILTFLRTVKRRLPENKKDQAVSKEETKTDSTNAVRIESMQTSDGKSGAKEPVSSSTLPVIAVGQEYVFEKKRREQNVSLSAIQDAIKLQLADDSQSASRKRRRSNSAKAHLAAKLEIGPQVVLHGLVAAGYDESVKLTDLAILPDAAEKIFKAIEPLIELLHGARMESFPLKGYVFVDDAKLSKRKGLENEAKATDPAASAQAGGIPLPFSEFSPYLLAQHRGHQTVEFNTFDEAVDTYFARLESVLEHERLAKREKAALGRVDKLSRELRGRVVELEEAQIANERKAQAILANIEEVDLAIGVVRSALVSAVDWESLSVMVEEEKEKGNPVAETIHSLDLDRNQITLMLENTWADLDEDDEMELASEGSLDSDDSDTSAGEDEEEGEREISGNRKKAGVELYEKTSAMRKVLLVPVNLSLSAYANANEYFDKRKTAAVKKIKAEEVTDRTIRAAEHKVAAETQKMETEAAASSIRARRKVYWFEKFLWMVSSENFLIVAGRDAQQNEILVKRYMAQADVYVHADMHGAASVIIKNARRPGQTWYGEIPKMTLEQAGAFAMCRSSAWDAKITTSAWWVRAGQVSKTAPTGEYLTTGSFVIRGRKNFLDPCQLVMGFGFLFKIDESSVVNHRTERRLRGEERDEASAKALADTQKYSPESQGESLSEDLVIVGGGRGDSKVSKGESVPDQKVETDASKEPVQCDQTDGVELDEDASLFAKFATDGLTMNAEDEEDESPHDSKTASASKIPDNIEKHPNPTEDTEKDSNPTGPVGASSDNDENLVQQQPKQSKKQKQKPLPRGKRTKLKRMKKKYGDQDDDERAIALAALGTKPIKEMVGRHSSDELETTDHEKKETGGEQQRRPPKPTRREKREVMRLMEEEGILELSKLETESLTILDMLTSCPMTADIVQFALPVCAPYNALAGYKYRVKLLPGSMKRGKAYRAATSLFIKNATKDLKKCKQERDALRIVPESEAIHAMLGSVRVVAPGLAQIQAANKRKKKQSGKRKK